MTDTNTVSHDPSVRMAVLKSRTQNGVDELLATLPTKVLHAVDGERDDVLPLVQWGHQTRQIAVLSEARAHTKFQCFARLMCRPAFEVAHTG
jgi:hypothetical protein